MPHPDLPDEFHVTAGDRTLVYKRVDAAADAAQEPAVRSDAPVASTGAPPADSLSTAHCPLPTDEAPDSLSTAHRPLPTVLYRRRDAPLLVEPTGAVLVRFAEETPAEDRRAALADAGFEIDRVLPYAPHAAWVRPADGEVASALAGLDTLRDLEGVEHVEPELLQPKGKK